MLKRDHFDIISSLVIMAVAAYLLLEASAIDAPANVYPLVILTVVIALSFLSTLSTFRRLRLAQAATDTEPEDTTKSKKVWGIVLAIIAYAFGMQFDYTISTCLFLFVMFLWLSGGDFTFMRALKALLMAAALTVFLYVAFVTWLNVSVPNIFL